MNDAPLLVPAAEVAKMLSMGTSTFWREVGRRNLPQLVEIGGLIRRRVADLVRCVKEMTLGDDVGKAAAKLP